MKSSIRSWRLLSRVLTRQLTHLHAESSLPSPGAAGSKLVPLIGLEIHAQLSSRTKLFSRAPYRFAAPPNSQLALLDMAIPGSMPVLNRRCVEAAILIALALNCQINRVSRFDRKHYFYADSPSGYQITQHAEPIAHSGYLDYIWSSSSSSEETHLTEYPLTQSIVSQTGQSYALSRARIKRVQLEQDTGKSLHDAEHKRSLIDFNRAGVGLVELVTEPDFVHAGQTAAFVNELTSVLSALEVCGANASLGELRVDVNVSVGPSLTEQGPRTEVKNVNSVRGVARAIEFEIDRQISLLRSGVDPINETRTFDPVQGITLPMRDKEVIQDYRYFPEPNIPPLKLLSTCHRCHHATPQSPTHPSTSSVKHPSPHDRICLNCMRLEYERILAAGGMRELPNLTKKKLLIEHGLGQDKATVLVNNRTLLHLYEECLALFSDDLIKRMDVDILRVHRELGYWVCGPLFSIFEAGGLACLPSPQTLAEFVELNISGEIHGSGASQLLSLLTNPDTSKAVSDRSPRELAQAHGWILIHDPEQMRAACEQVVRDNPKLISLYKAGKEKKALKRLATLLLTTNAAKYRSEKFNPFVAERLIKSIIQTTGCA